MIGEHIKYLLAVINSSLIHWYFQHTLGSTSGVGTNRWLKYTVECIPVPLIQDDTEWETLVDDIQEYKRDSKETRDLEDTIDKKGFARRSRLSSARIRSRISILNYFYDKLVPNIQ